MFGIQYIGVVYIARVVHVTTECVDTLYACKDGMDASSSLGTGTE